MPQLLITPLGLTPYADALALQRAAARARVAGTLDEDLLLLVEHPPVVTLGRSTKATSLPLPVDVIRARGVEVFEVERGGDVTFHGPGQLVGYPVIDLKRHRRDLHWYLRQVEQALIDAVAAFGVAGTRNPGYTGVWTGPVDAAGAVTPARKLASIGVHARDWVTWHGFALNVTPEPLGSFDLIVPCGIAGVEMTAVAREARGNAGSITVAAVAHEVERTLAAAFALTPVPLPADALYAQLRASTDGAAAALSQV